MNIFVLHEDPQIAARMHCDKHVVKMILETAQMLCTAHHKLDSKIRDHLYRPTHVSHPCTVWVRSTQGNYLWAYQLFFALCAEYHHRYGKVHKTYAKLDEFLCDAPKQIPMKERTAFALAMPDEFKQTDAVQAYRDYYNGTKSHLFAWTNREIPDWVVHE